MATMAEVESAFCGSDGGMALGQDHAIATDKRDVDDGKNGIKIVDSNNAGVNVKSDKFKIVGGVVSNVATTLNLPQDMPFSSPDVASDHGTVSDGSPAAGSDVNAHAWVSPNKSDEVVNSSKESTPDENASEQTKVRDNISPVEKLLSFDEESASGRESNGTDYEEDFEAVTEDLKELSIIGERVESNTKVAVPPLDFTSMKEMEPSIRVDASSKDWIKVVHDGKEILTVLPAKDCDELGPVYEFSDAIASALDINATDEIVGIRTAAEFFNEDCFAFQQHGDFVLPISAVASGQLKQMLKNATSIPEFSLVLRKSYSLCGAFSGSAAGAEAESTTEMKKVNRDNESEDEEFVDDVSNGTLNEIDMCIETFVQLMEQSGADFNAEEKNVLLKFGKQNIDIDFSHQSVTLLGGNILLRAAFRVAVYMEDMGHFTRGLKSIAKVLLGRKPTSLPTNEGNSDTLGKSIFQMIDFVRCADELFDLDDLSAEQYVTLLHHIFNEDEDIERLFDLNRCPEFLEACESDEMRESLLMRDLLHLAKAMDPIKPTDSAWSDDDLKFAISAGVHNLSTQVDVPNDFITVMFHMFSSGDELVLDACKNFLETGDSNVMEEMLMREWRIFLGNQQRETFEYSLSTEDGDKVNEKGGDDNLMLALAEAGLECPDVLLTAVACLCDLDQITEEEGVAIIASYQRGNVLLHEIYDNYIEGGDTDEFLDMLKAVSRTTQFKTPRKAASATSPSEDEDMTTEVLAEESAYDIFRGAIDELKENLGPLEMAALRLAAVQKSPLLIQTLSEYRISRDMTALETGLSQVVDNIVRDYYHDSDTPVRKTAQGH